jgi:hypothetical protein
MPYELSHYAKATGTRDTSFVRLLISGNHSHER